MNLSRVVRLIPACFILILGPLLSSSAFDRIPNTTLNLPQDRFSGYAVEPDPMLSQVSRPMQVLAHPSISGAFYVIEREGRLVLFQPNQEPTVVLDISALVGPITGELGFISAALHPNFPQTPYIFCYYTARSNQKITNQLSRFELSDDGVTFVNRSRRNLIIQPDEHSTHNGGTLLFGKDGYLYLSLGDGGGSGWEHKTQMIDGDFFSAILRIDVDSRPDSLLPNPHPAVIGNYRIPPDNPFIGATEFAGKPVDPATVRTEFYAVGLRNPFRMGIDVLTGEIWFGDVGEATFEEVNILQAGANYGWPVYEGPFPMQYGPDPVPGVDYTAPVYYYGRDVGVAVTGGFVYRGSKFPELYGSYLFADYLGRIWAAWFDETGNATVKELLKHSGPILAVQADPRDQGVIVTVLDQPIFTLERRVTEDFSPPERLSDTGVFSNLETLELAPGFEPYEVNVPFWSDNALKSRAFYIPTDQKISFQAYENWGLPSGSVWVKHFELELEEESPASAVRVETRLIVMTNTGSYGITYKWNEDQNEAFLVNEDGENVPYQIQTSDGGFREQVWRIPSRAQCMDCHTAVGGHALSFTTQQLNREVGGQNQLSAMAAAGYFDVYVINPNAAPKLYAPDDETVSLTDRAKSYLEANCANCHQPGGPGGGEWDARAKTMLALSKIIYGDLERPDVQGTHVVAPNDPAASAILQRINRRGHEGQMPPMATSIVDQQGVALIERWIADGLNDPHEWDAWFLPAEGSMWIDSWYGWFWRTPGSDFIYHVDHGWQYVLPVIAAGDGWEVFLWDYGIEGWLYTGPDIPHFTYHFDSGSWLYYAGASGGLRYFWNYKFGDYVTFP